MKSYPIGIEAIPDCDLQIIDGLEFHDCNNDEQRIGKEAKTDGAPKMLHSNLLDVATAVNTTPQTYYTN